MPLVKVRRAGQITLPVELREQFALEEGAYLEAEAVPGGILLKPKVVVDRAEAWDQLRALLDRVHAQQPPTDQTPLEQEEEIAQMIKDFRRDHAHDRP
jgi:AbrB family looped-hinge helix DNA binding protein